MKREEITFVAGFSIGVAIAMAYAFLTGMINEAPPEAPPVAPPSCWMSGHEEVTCTDGETMVRVGHGLSELDVDPSIFEEKP